MIKLAIVGATGKMGQEIIRQVSKYSHKYEIVAKIASNTTNNNINNIKNINVCIDFSSPVATLNILNYCLENHTALVIGTTGFNNDELEIIYNASIQIPILIAPNMSVSVNVLMKLVTIAASVLDDFESEIFEAHHKYKKDSPSGTAIQLGKCIAKARKINFDKHAVYTRHGRDLHKINNEIGFSVLRAGNIVGLHEVSFISDDEQLVLKSEINNRSSFARGALMAADFICNKPAGLYSMEDIFKI